MADIQELRTAPRFNVYSRSSDDDNVEHGLVSDISETGACLTLPKDTPLFKGEDPEQSASSYGCLRLNIFHPDYAIEHSFDINTNIAWLDHEYSKKRLKLGVNFSDMDADKSSQVCDFIDWIKEEENYFLHCELEKC